MQMQFKSHWRACVPAGLAVPFHWLSERLKELPFDWSLPFAVDQVTVLPQIVQFSS